MPSKQFILDTKIEMALRLTTVVSSVGHSGKPRFRFRIRSVAATVRNMAFSATSKVIDSHLHVWASPQEVTENILHFFTFIYLYIINVNKYYYHCLFLFYVVLINNTL